MSELNAELLSILTVAELLGLIAGAITVPRSHFTPKAKLIEWIIVNSTGDLSNALTAACEAKLQQGAALREAKKRKRAATLHSQRKARHQRWLEEADMHNIEDYLKLPSEDELLGCYREFIEATSNAATKLVVCAVCAREVSHRDDIVSEIPLKEIPHRDRLTPSTPHHMHDIFEGMLLEPTGIISEGLESPSAQVCKACLDHLERIEHGPPPLSLANDLWIGPIPWELQVLTVPEQLLVALLYPRVYVFKLFPKDKDFRPKDDTLQHGMRGNVSTYEQDIDGVAAMVEGHLMPRPVEILSRVLTITYIGRGQLLKHSLHSTFRVRREVVKRALLWLKTNNPKYYGDIQIDEERLGSLPDDDVPSEIFDVARHTPDIGIVDQEAPGYVPEDPPSSTTDDMLGHEATGLEEQEENGASESNDTDNDQPDVIPMQVSGAIDTDLTTLTSKELMLWGLANLWKEGHEGPYSIRHGTQPVRDLPPRRPADEDAQFTRPDSSHNLFEKAFPCLFPYGCGGLEAQRPIAVDFPTHIRWCLQYHDRRFRKHQTFPFLCFGIVQKRHALSNAQLQMKRKNFEHDARIMSSLTAAKLRQAAAEEEQGLAPSDPAVRLLLRHVHATAGRVVGTDQSRYRLRSQIRSTSIEHGPPTIWATWNLSDHDDPLAQAFLGENIDLDNFIATLGPDRNTRASNVAADPYGAAKFFHFAITAILETLVQMKVSKYQVRSKPGIFGEASAYFGTVESQGRGTLHLHILIWLKNTPTGDELDDLFKNEQFRLKMAAYIKANVRAYVPGLESPESVKAMPRQPGVAFSRPPKPGADNYEADMQARELQLARSLQVHTCKIRRCLQPNKNGKLVCKRKAPWKCAAHDFVTDAGQWGPKRLYAYVNGYNPAILIHAGCNNDCKILTNGSETKNITYYITSYAAKKQGRNYNLSAILADGYVYHLKNPRDEYIDRLRENQRLLLFRLVHTINREQELSSSMVIAYLMKWGDVYRSHLYTAVYWSSFVAALLKQCAGIQVSSPQEPEPPLGEAADNVAGPSHVVVEQEGATETSLADQDIPDDRPNNPISEEHLTPHLPSESQGEANDEDGDDMITLDITPEGGHVYAKSQVTDYQLRGDELEECNVHDFFRDTYETALLNPRRFSARIVPEASDSETEDDNTGLGLQAQRRPGRRPNQRTHYLPQHPNSAHKIRVVRSALHRNMVNYVGRFFPSSKDANTYPLYCASMLALLKPWRDLAVDLKLPQQSWPDAFVQFKAQADTRILRILAGIEYYHDCRMAARDHVDEELPLDDRQDADAMRGIDDMELGEGVPETHTTVSEAAISEVLMLGTSPQELNHARHAIEIARSVKIFPDENDNWSVTDTEVKNAEGGDLVRLSEWQKCMHADVLRQNTAEDVATNVVAAVTDTANVTPQVMDGANTHAGPNIVATTPVLSSADGVLTAANVNMLKDDQFRAFDIMRWHLDQTLAGNQPPVLRMIIYGEGGTGKSKVIQTVTEEFARRGVQYMLVKSAYTGVAASLIDGKTTHTIAALSVKNGAVMSDDAKAKLQVFWKHRSYLILDEVSMLGKTHLQHMERNISIGMHGADGFKPDCTFGGLNVVLCGDLHQFPPVAKGREEFLFHPIRTYDDDDCKLGRRIYEQFQTVVVLQEQMRVTDPVWQDLLVHLRAGNVQREHVQILKRLVLSRPSAMIDFNEEPWKRAALVTPRHAVRLLWNEHASRKWCQATGTQLFVCKAEDTIHRGKKIRVNLSLAERYQVARRVQTDNRRRRADLPRSIELAKGMKVLVTSNLETDLDLTNGARGEIIDIILHPDEPAIGQTPVVELRYLPQYVLVKMAKTRASQLAGLDACVIPVEPATSTMQIKLQTHAKKAVQRTVHRRQFPITSAYAFTDYRAQGQTLPYVVVDIATPPSGGLNLFNLYVALSRSTGRDSIRLLRDFDPGMFMQSHEPELALEDERLEDLDRITKQWWIAMGGEQRLLDRG
ncbi:hypothetical protein PHLCEN_2v2137 [Hermanssonia centrifuga]|uniref:ATP-dependent DNA helicase n=1 Tax=Hermanssonia centrifuga TaxID=98765 RepID=A0A2R6RQ00_9APHY|nr:hypothetical protein PHLCEN_2v2137 [Hermanssonia centrifuga]